MAVKVAISFVREFRFGWAVESKVMKEAKEKEYDIKS